MRLCIFWLPLLLTFSNTDGLLKINDTKALRDKAVEMFDHAYNSYMTHAFPADELMPLSCQGRFRGNRPSRGDVDESLGNFTLTLVDTLDTLALLGKFEEFETAVRLVLQHTSFDTDVVVSVFETNIRVLGGLLGGHVTAVDLKSKGKCCIWYTDELLEKALDLGVRLLPAFNSTSGIPYPKVNLKTGLRGLNMRDTCTACAGTMVLEFAALSRLTGDMRFEEAAHKAMDFLWSQRNIHSNLMGTVLNVNNGDWVRRESGIGAGIDSYYEYLLKAYILLGDDVYLTRFNKHYDAIMTYINQGPLMLSVDMHKPTVSGRNIMDSLLAFWPGLQVLKGDLKSAIEMHEVLYQITQRHKFLPEAVTADFHVHWGQHPLRPEFVESTYFLYKATGDPHYRDVGRTVLENLEAYARVPCGFAAIKDVRGNTHEDQMDSFVLAETFKYLYLLFEEEGNIALDVSQYVFTTEAHLLPLSLANHSVDSKKAAVPARPHSSSTHDHSCPNIRELSRMSLVRYAETIRSPLKNFVELKCPKPKPTSRTPRLRAREFLASDPKHVYMLESMGVQLLQTSDGRLQLTHSPTKAQSNELAEEGLAFMKEMLELAQSQQEVMSEPRVVQLTFPLSDKPSVVLQAGPAQFGWNFKPETMTSQPLMSYNKGYKARVIMAEPLEACTALGNAAYVSGKIAVVKRGACTFIEKARLCSQAGAVGVIVIDNVEGSSKAQGGFFQMSGDDVNDVSIPVVFLFSSEAQVLTNHMKNEEVEAYLARNSNDDDDLAVPEDNTTEQSDKPEYPKNMITFVDSDLNLYVEMERFAVSVTVQNTKPRSPANRLTDAIDVEVTDNGKHVMALTAERTVHFDAARNEMPVKGQLAEILTDVVTSYLEDCSHSQEVDTYVVHLTNLIELVTQAYIDDEEEPTPRAEHRVFHIIGLLQKCVIERRESKLADEGQDKVTKVSNLEVPHVGELPEFYIKPAASEDADLDASANEDADSDAVANEDADLDAAANEDADLDAVANEDADLDAAANEDVDSDAVANEDADLDAAANEDVDSDAVANEDADLDAAANEDVDSDAVANEDADLDAAANEDVDSDAVAYNNSHDSDANKRSETANLNLPSNEQPSANQQETVDESTNRERRTVEDMEAEVRRLLEQAVLSEDEQTDLYTDNHMNGGNIKRADPVEETVVKYKVRRKQLPDSTGKDEL